MTQFNASPDSTDPSVEPLFSRGDFLKHIWGKAASYVETQLGQELEKIKQPLQTFTGIGDTPKPFLRPPGAHANDLMFLTLCTRCDACTAACPHETISVHYGSGYPHDGTPVLADLAANPCRLCTDLPCIAACPTDALTPLAGIEAIKIGEAKIDNTTCLAYQGQACQLCFEACPLPNAIELVENLPIIQEACTGCGLCLPPCPTNPGSIIVM